MIGRVGAAAFPMLYLGLPIGALVSVRTLHGREALALLMLTVIVSDTAQYYSGRLFGRRPLAPAISPKKTVEGAIGGFVFGAVALAVVGRLVAARRAGAAAGRCSAWRSSRSASPAICSSRC